MTWAYIYAIRFSDRRCGWSNPEPPAFRAGTWGTGMSSPKPVEQWRVTDGPWSADVHLAGVEYVLAERLILAARQRRWVESCRGSSPEGAAGRGPHTSDDISVVERVTGRPGSPDAPAEFGIETMSDRPGSRGWGIVVRVQVLTDEVSFVSCLCWIS